MTEKAWQLIEQARACADAGVFLISPFVGRITDWYKANTDVVIDTPAQDPGVQSVSKIFNHYKTHGYDTVVMGDLLDALGASEGHLPEALNKAQAASAVGQPISEAEFRFEHNESAMASEKLADGIRRFVADQVKLEAALA